MNKICSNCMEKANLNKQYPCVRCSNNEIYNSKGSNILYTTIGIFKCKLKNYYNSGAY